MTQKKILSSNHNKIFKLKDKIVLTTDNGIFEYDEAQNDFVDQNGWRIYLARNRSAILKKMHWVIFGFAGIKGCGDRPFL
jgi:hypothetical protein